MKKLILSALFTLETQAKTIAVPENLNEGYVILGEDGSVVETSHSALKEEMPLSRATQYFQDATFVYYSEDLNWSWSQMKHTQKASNSNLLHTKKYHRTTATVGNNSHSSYANAGHWSKARVVGSSVYRALAYYSY
ncbi:lactococcin 972 family bacteriocin [Carnobacterium gallinarum]|uniref:lactococcin 972 family bacteriocin n=1 Tax=Carnobacterium gallinarum TaxID=2749 RepID=UPI000550D451|nr:lactococcin 972 family bacteriocin [Carnobacterium gallinarum]